MNLKPTIIALATITLTAGCSFNHGPVAATVNGQPIYLSDLQADMRREILLHAMGKGSQGQADWKKIEKMNKTSAEYRRYERGTLEGMIDQILVDQRTPKLGISVSAKEINDELASYQQTFIDHNAFERAVKQSGVSEADLESEIKDQLLFQKLQDSIIQKDQVTKAQVNAYYQKHKKDFMLPQSIHLEQIFNKEKANIDQAKAALDHGLGWDAAVTHYTQDSYTLYANGDIGDYTKGYLVSAIDQAVWKAKPGQIVGPIQTPLGWYLMKVVAFVPQHPDSLSDVYFTIYHQMSEARRNTIQADFLTDIRKGADIKYEISWLKPQPKAKAAAKSNGRAANGGTNHTVKTGTSSGSKAKPVGATKTSGSKSNGKPTTASSAKG